MTVVKVKRPRTKGVNEYTDPRVAPKCNRFSEPFWDEESGHWRRKLNRLGQAKLEMFFQKHGHEGGMVLGLMKITHPKAHSYVVSKMVGRFDEVTARIWQEIAVALTRWEEACAKFITVAGIAAKAAGSRVMYESVHPDNQYHFSLSDDDGGAEGGFGTADALTAAVAEQKYRDELAGRSEFRVQHLLDDAKGLLTTREYDLLVAKYCHDRTLREIGTRHDLSKERVRQVIASALRKLKQRAKVKNLWGDVDAS